MQPRTLAIIITLFPLFITSTVFLLSAYEGTIPWCIPNLDGCVSISKTARSGNSLFIFRATMIAYAILLIWFWLYVRQWLDELYGQTTNMARTIFWLGVIGALSLIIYINFLGTTGEINRFMRRYGILIYFICIPLAQILLLRQHFEIFRSRQDITLKGSVLHYQLVIIILMLFVGIVSGILDVSTANTDKSENIVEWNIALLMQLYFFGMVSLWKKYKYYMKNG